MSSLTPEDLFQFLQPSLVAVFGRADVTSLQTRCSDTLREFITNPTKTLLLAVKNETLIFQTTFCYTQGPIVLCQKQPQVLPAKDFQSLLSIFPLSSEEALPFLQSVIGQFFLPYFQNTLSVEDSIVRELFGALRRFDMSANRLRHIVPLPEPVLDISEELLSAQELNMSQEEETTVLSEIDRWKMKVDTVLNTANEPPEFTAIRDEIDFWSKLASYLGILQSNVEKLVASKLPEVIVKNKPWIKDFLAKKMSDLPSLCGNVSTFAKGLAQFDPDDGFDRCATVEELIEKMKRAFNWWNPFCEKCNIEKRIPAIYSLLVDFFLTHLAAIIYRSGVLNIDFDPKDITNSVEVLMSQWRENEAIMMEKLRSHQVRAGVMLTAQKEFNDRFQQFLQIKKECNEMIENILAHENLECNEAVGRIRNAYALVRNAPILDLNTEATGRWRAALGEYRKEMRDIDEFIGDKLQALLSKFNSLSDLYDVFRTHKVLCRRETINGILVEHQRVFLTEIFNQLESFRTTELANWSKSSVVRLMEVRGATSITASYLHFRRIFMKLEKFETMLNDVIGEGWRNSTECQQIAATFDGCNRGIKNNDEHIQQAKKIFDSLETDVLSKYLFIIEERQGHKSIKCNFSPYNGNTLSTFKSLKQFGLVDTMTINVMSRLEKCQKFYLRLQEGLNLFLATMAKIKDDPVLEEVAAEQIEGIYELIHDGWNYRWMSDQKTLKLYSRKFSQSICYFHNEVAKASVQLAKVEELLATMQEAPEESMAELIGETLSAVDLLFQSQMSNDEEYVGRLNARIAAILSERIDSGCGKWLDLLKARNKQNKTLVVVKLGISGNQIFVQPRVEHIHPILNRVIARQMDSFLLLNQITTMYGNSELGTFQDLVKIPHDKIWEIYQCVEALSNDVAAYVNEWTVNEILFRNEPESLQNAIESDDITKWVELLKLFDEKAQIISDCPETKIISVVVVDTKTIQKSIKDRIAKWKDYVIRTLQNNMAKTLDVLYEEIDKSRSELEGEIPTKAKELAAYLTQFRNVSAKKQQWDSIMPAIRDAAKFVPVANLIKITNNLETFSQVYEAREKEIEGNNTGLCSLVERECAELVNEVNKVRSKWEVAKPLNGNTVPEAALKTVAEYQEQFEKLEAEWKELDAAREALRMQREQTSVISALLEDCNAIREVWGLLSTVWDKLSALRSQKFITISAPEFRTKISGLVDKLQQMSGVVKEYEAWTYFHQRLRGILKEYPIIEGLKSPAVLPRHWQQISQHYKQKINMEEVTIGQIYDLDLEANESFFSEVLRNAQGEFSLRQYLDQLDQVWDSLEFEFSDFKGKMNLIKGWDTILTTIADHLNFLSTMQSSPFFNAFREQAKSWESRLNHLQVLLDDWLDVQRRFVYLEGVFGSQDIRSILAKATTQFRKNEKEFIGLTKRAAQMKVVMKVLSIPNVDSVLQTLNDSLLLLQKELSDYLEKQRAFFPRFFFIGDEDLLEIIGKSSAIQDIQRHFGKMFEGLSGVTVDKSQVVKMNCGSCEAVPFNTAVNITGAIYQTLSDIEKQMRESLQRLLSVAVKSFEEFWAAPSLDKLREFIATYPAQVSLLAFFVISTMTTERAISNKSTSTAVDEVVKFIDLLSQLVFSDLSPSARHSVQQLITESVHHRNLARELGDIDSISSFEWTRFLRFYYNAADTSLTAKIGDAEFKYGFEYLGLTPSLVRTPLTDRVYLTMAQALYAKMGGSPFGPAGTGKTETVKNMGHHLGRHVLVFNCDETFDFKAMGRIFIGLCHCGSWGCFDEFNRLDEQMLSAVSQQIQTIQIGLKAKRPSVEILGKKAPLNPAMGIFITMNPGYAGRVELPDNLKQLFRTMAMNRPDTELITEVLLFSQGFASAEKLAPKFVSLFSMAKESLSHQTHYDFGLRAMKSVLTNAGQLIRSHAINREGDILEQESRLVISSIVNALFPKLLSSDLAKLQRLIEDIFPGIKPEDIAQAELIQLIKEEAENFGWIASEIWVNKIIQLYYIQQISHGFMLVGPSATGKTSSRTILLNVLSKIDKQESESYVINPKSVTKDTLFGALDPVTREWTDGVFTRILRTIVDNQRGEMNKRHWIVFDGDVDPEWVENLNSVLDDNKLLTLPNGERISLPSNVRIVFEVENLNYATPATVSRCGIVFFSPDTLKSSEIVSYHMHHLAKEAIINPNHLMYSEFVDIPIPDMISKQSQFLEVVKPTVGQVIELCLTFWNQHSHSAIMELPVASCISTFFTLLSASFVSVFRSTPDNAALNRAVIFAGYWAFALPFSVDIRTKLDEMIRNQFYDMAPNGSLLNHMLNAEMTAWENAEMSDSARASEGFVLTSGSEVSQKLIQMFLSSGHTLVLCGPDGIGKQSILHCASSLFPEVETVRLNLSNCSSIDFVLKTIEQFCAYTKSSTATRLKPKTANSFILFECIHLNLPSMDKYGTQRVVEFLRQMVDLNGFWHPQRREWIQLDMISFTGVCCPPTAYGRVKLSPRFLRHASIFCLEHPPKDAIVTIVNTLLSRANIDSQEEIANVVSQFYQEFREHFRASLQLHYSANMRDLIDWVDSLKYEISCGKGCEIGHIVYDTGLRTFADRLEEASEKDWVYSTLQNMVTSNFAGLDGTLFEPSMLYSRIRGAYSLMSTDVMRKQVEQKMKLYSEQNSTGDMVFFDECVQLMSKVERRLCQPGGHILIAGLSGTGKVTIPSFVAWYSEQKVFRLRVHKEYSIADFDADLRKILRATLNGHVCFIVKETDIILPIFTERLNVLLAESRVPGLFAGDELATLLAELKDSARASGQLLETEDAMFDYFVEKVKTNLHVVFSANSAVFDINKTNIMFPSLAAVCNIIWVGTWSDASLQSFAAEVIKERELDPKESTITALVKIHHSAIETSVSLPVTNYVSPRYFYDFVNQFCNTFIEKSKDLTTEQQHLANGLSKLEQTQKDVARMSKELEEKKAQLKEKEQLAEQKLEEILKDREATSTRKEEAQKLKLVIDDKRKVIEADKAKAMAELDEVAPAIEEAKSSVSNIKKSNLDEIRRLSQPPDVIKNTLQAVLTLLDTPQSTWAGIRKVISGDTFIRSVLDFKVDNLAQSVLKKVTHLIESTDLTYEKAQRASQACGPLFKWMSANMRYLQIVESTAPLRAKVTELENENKVLMKRHAEMSDNIKVFEKKLAKLSAEYKVLLSACEKTRKEAEQVQAKLDRATQLLSSLTSETQRWVERRNSFETERQNLLGHSILSSAFTTYCGYLEQQRRVDSVIAWMAILGESKVRYNEEYQFADFMTDPEHLIEWSGKQLPKDDLCIQNAIILSVQTKKTPLIIDPAGQATQFIVNSYSNLVRTSFVDKKFSKHLESCLRFGSPLLIEDGEQMDPLVLPVLAHEFKRASGRTLLELKKNDIDVSPSFQMFIVTRDTDFAPEPSVSSMTVLVNFSVTTLSLCAQCMTRLLQFKLPDIEKRRKELHESLAAMHVELRKREESMLNVFSTTKGEILEDNKLLNMLEDIKKEAVHIGQKADETKQTLQEITRTSEQYAAVAEISTSLYFALRDMSSVHYLYQFSLKYFWAVFDRVVSNDATSEQLMKMIAHGLFVDVSYSLLNKHLPVIGFRFGQILLESEGCSIDESLYDLALRGSTVYGQDPSFMKICQNPEFKDWLNQDSPELNLTDKVKSELGSNDRPAVTALKVLAVLRRVRPDRIISASRIFIKEALQYDLDNIPPFDLVKAAADTSCSTPLLLCASAGQDPSGRVETVAVRPIESLAVGAADSYGAIEQAVQTAAQRGNWVIVKNVHLAPLWTRSFVKTIANLSAHSDFRIFLTSEINPKVGSNVFRSCRVVVFESATGIRANLRRAYTNGFQWPDIPQERRRLVLNFLWLHSTIMERLRYEPLGWSKRYEFNDADLMFATQVGIRWLEAAANGRSHISEEQFPWTAIRFLISSCVYGGRVDAPTDQRILKAMTELMFTPKAQFGDGLITLPQINTFNEFQAWADGLPSSESPEMLWLPKNSGKFLFIQQGKETLQHILSVVAGSASRKAESKQSNFVRVLLEQWKEKLESNATKEFKAKPESLIASVVEDELVSLRKTREVMIKDIGEILVNIENGDAMTQDQGKILECLERSVVPDSWNAHGFLCTDLNNWIDDFVARIVHINNVISDKDLGRGRLNLGLLKSPESLLAAAKQTAARDNKWPTEQIRMKLEVGKNAITSSSDIVAIDIISLCAEWKNSSFAVSDEVVANMPSVLIAWTLDKEGQAGIVVPCFMTKSKRRQVFEAVLPVDKSKSDLWWTVRNPALVLQQNAI